MKNSTESDGARAPRIVKFLLCVFVYYAVAFVVNLLFIVMVSLGVYLEQVTHDAFRFFLYLYWLPIGWLVSFGWYGSFRFWWIAKPERLLLKLIVWCWRIITIFLSIMTLLGTVWMFFDFKFSFQPWLLQIWENVILDLGGKTASSLLAYACTVYLYQDRQTKPYFWRSLLKNQRL